MSRFLVIWIALALGCRDPAVSRLDEVRAAVCMCKSTPCAEAAMKVVPSMKIKPSPRSQKIAREMLDCLAKLNAGERPTTGPDEPTPAADLPAPLPPPAKP